MTRLTKSLSVLALGALAACGQTPLPVIHPEPSFDKLGDGTCPEGYTYIPGALYEGTCDPDDDRRPDRPGDDDDRPGRDPTGFTLTAVPIDPQ